jgi:MarR family transcriptional regulator, transcriptional regulator for hemolysin
MFLLAQAGHVLMTELTAGLAGLGISQRDYCVLSNALAHGELTQIRLAELCGLDKTTMVVTMDELERNGLAERRPSVTDRRVRIIAITRAGERKVADARKVVDRIHAEVLDSLPSGECEAFVNALERLVSGRLSTPVHCDRPVRRRSPKA